MARAAVILGAGVGGITVANELRKRSSSADRIVVIDRNPIYVFAPSLLWVSVGARTSNQIRKPVRALLRPGVEFLEGTVESIDAAEKVANIDERELSADTIVVALGAELAPESIPGLAQAGHNFYTLAGAEGLHVALEAFTGGKVIVLTTQAGYKCPAAPYEEVMLIEEVLRKRGIRENSTLELHAAEPAPMPTAGPAVGEALTGMLRAKNIAYFPNRKVTSVDGTARVISFDDGSTAAYDLLAFVPPHRPPQVLVNAGFGGDSGWIPVDRSTMQTRFEDVYAIGDATGIVLPSGKPLPKAGVIAHAEARVVATNVASSWASRAGNARFDGHGACFVETGDGRAAIGLGDFYAEPVPLVTLKAPSLVWHIAKVLLEKRWLRQLPFQQLLR
jgi:sulfide:quinone oxidoreductase